MIKLVLFDLDGVLVEAKNIHFEALNEALDYKYRISWTEHLSKYDGLKTNQKLEMLTLDKGLPKEKYNQVWNHKQKITLEKLRQIERSDEIAESIYELCSRDLKIGVCSNSIKKTIITVLNRLMIIEDIDFIVSNEDVKNSKPHPEMYWKAMSIAGVLPSETLIVEDSPYGLQAAYRSGANVYRVKTPSDVTKQNLIKKINEIDMKRIDMIPNWVDKKLNVLIPMAGAGSRFQNAGYTFPKPLIAVDGKPMIQLVVENLKIDANYIFVVQKSHRKMYNLDTLLNLISPNCKIVEVDGITEGAACTALLAKEYINNDNPLFFANSDQYVEWNSNEFFYKMNENDADGGIPVFESTHPKWSFAKLDELGFISEVQEKNPISNLATVGFYYWKKGEDFVKYAEEMINQNMRVNNEFYVCPVYNNAIKAGLKIRPFHVNKMWGLGTPEDLNYYLQFRNKE
jgi:HAD superfamily hydrolase (TIGR01509 family)